MIASDVRKSGTKYTNDANLLNIFETICGVSLKLFIAFKVIRGKEDTTSFQTIKTIS